MEHARENESRNGRPSGGSASDTGRQMPLSGFEGMNYEQRREPYHHKRQQKMTNSNGNDQQESFEQQNNDRS